MIAGLLLIGGAAWAQSDPPANAPQAAENSTEQLPGARGWDGTLPSRPAPSGGSGNVQIFNFFVDNGPSFRGAPGYGGFCGSHRSAADWRRPDHSRSAGAISGGTFGTTVRCDDAYPGLPLRDWRERDRSWTGDEGSAGP